MAAGDQDRRDIEVTIIGNSEVRKASKSEESVRMTVTDFAEADENYEVIKTEDGFIASKVDGVFN